MFTSSLVWLANSCSPILDVPRRSFESSGGQVDPSSPILMKKPKLARALRSRAAAWATVLARIRTKWQEQGLVGRSPFDAVRARFYRGLWENTARACGAE